MKQSSTDVLVVGAGPVGLMMAGELTRHGVECLTVDRLPAPSPHSRAVGVEARTLEIFENLGVLQRAFERGLRVAGINVYREGRRVERHDLDHKPTPEVPFPLVFSLEQSLTEQILTENLVHLGGHLERGVEFTELSQDEDGVTAMLTYQDGTAERVRCRYLVGCDGADSRVREAVGIGCSTESPGARWRLWDVELEWPLTEGEVHRFEPDLICLPLRGVWRYQILSPDTGAEQEKPPTLDELGPLLPRDSSARELRWSSRQHIRPRLADHYRQQRVFLAGDAAHLSGQGLNTGLQDAYNLAWKLALILQGKAPRKLLDSYEAERRPAAQLTLQDISPMMPADPFKTLAQNYRHSPVVQSHPEDAELQAGDRAPDGTLISGGMPVRVFQLLRGTHHHLLAFAGGAGGGQVARLAGQVAERHPDRVLAHVITGPGTPVPATSLVTLRDSDYQLHQAYGFDGPGVALVRPDGYVAFRADLGHVDELLPYLQGLFLPL